MSRRETFGDMMKEYRKQEGLTQKQLGELLGVKQTDISLIESGRKQAPPEAEAAFTALWRTAPEPKPEPAAPSTGEAGKLLVELMAAARQELEHPMSPEEAETLSSSPAEELLSQSVLLREALEVQASRELLAGAREFRKKREAARREGGRSC